MHEALTDQWRSPERLRSARVASFVAVVAALLMAGALLGCGSDDESSDEDNANLQQTFPPQVVRDSEIESQESGSPERALLEWWQAFQFSDAGAVVNATSQATLDAVGESELTELVKTRGQGLQGIEVLGASTDGNSASVRVGLLTFQPEREGAPPPTTPTASKPTTFAMTKEGDEWVYDETAFLEPMLEGLKRSAEEQEGNEKQETEGTATE